MATGSTRERIVPAEGEAPLISAIRASPLPDSARRNPAAAPGRSTATAAVDRMALRAATSARLCATISSRITCLSPESSQSTPVFPVSVAGSVDWGDREDWEDLFSRYRGSRMRSQSFKFLIGGARVDGPAGQLDPALPIAGQFRGAQCCAGVGQHNIAARAALALQDRRGDRGVLLGTTTGDRLGRGRGESQVGGSNRVCPHG